MSILSRFFCLAAFAGVLSSASADQPALMGIAIGAKGVIRADSHGPIGAMGDHMHSKGEWMVSYRYMEMDMDGNRDGKSRISPEEIVTTAANPFFGRPMQPATLRVVPTQMTMKMHMLGFMYAPSDWLTLTLMGSYLQTDMDHLTFKGGKGTEVLGSFKTRTGGIGDVKLTGLIRLYDDDTHHFHAHAGFSLPTGSIDERDHVLTPMGSVRKLRLPYPMQLGSGTLDLLPGLTYTGKAGVLGWGSQYSATLRSGKNDEGYSLGDQHRLTAWLSYSLAPSMSMSARLAGQTTGRIDDQDSEIVAPVQTANPDNHGGDRVDFLLGVNLVSQSGLLKGHRFAAEFGVPVHQDLNGPQMETDYLFTLGYQKSF